jgi:hypothetical protein
MAISRRLALTFGGLPPEKCMARQIRFAELPDSYLMSVRMPHIAYHVA